MLITAQTIPASSDFVAIVRANDRSIFNVPIGIQAESIREYIERRATAARVVTVIWVLVVIVLALLVFPNVVAMFGTGSMLVGLVPILVLYYVIGRWTNCPRCKGSLSKAMTEVIFTPANVPDKCPHCGVSIDARV